MVRNFFPEFGADPYILLVNAINQLRKPKEWFLAPLYVIDEAVQRIRDGSIVDVVYAPKTARLESK